MISKFLRAIIMGPPGSGKGTISERIVRDFGMTHLSSGNLLRAQIVNNSDLGAEAKKYIDDGLLVPDIVMVNLIAEELQQLREHSWLLDGFPRTVPQAEALIQKEPVNVVVNLDIPFDVIINRIKGRWTHLSSGRVYHTEFNPPKIPGEDDVTGETLVQRDDDKEETVRARLQTYQKKTQPVLDFYRSHGLLAEFNGQYSNEIWPRVHKFLSAHTKPLQYTEYK